MGQGEDENSRKINVLFVKSIPAPFIFPIFTKLISKVKENIKIYSDNVWWDYITQYHKTTGVKIPKMDILL